MTKPIIYQQDKTLIIDVLNKIQPYWDGKESILKLKGIDYQWRQMEWMAFYFEALCQDLLPQVDFKIPGKKYGKVEFDSFRSINWDMKTSAIKSDNHKVILNDKLATDTSLKEFGYHGIILALVDVEYNDDNRSFQKWHAKLKGKKSKYEQERIARNATSRYRKTSAEVKQILLLVINKDNQPYLDIHKQGRNSDGNPRNHKYMLNIEQSHHFEVGRIDF